MSEIDFLPNEYLTRRASRRDQWYLAGIGLVALLVLLGSMFNLSRQTTNLREQLSCLNVEHADVLEQKAEIERLRERRRVLASAAAVGSLLRAHPSSSHLLLAVSGSCPPRVTLDQIRIRSERRGNLRATGLNTTARALPDSDAATAEMIRLDRFERFMTDHERARWSIEIVGLAESDLEVVDFLERLERTNRFEAVTLTSTERKTIGSVTCRGFSVQCWLRKIL